MAASNDAAVRAGLEHAAENNLVGVARRLLENGANPNIQTHSPIIRSRLNDVLQSETGWIHSKRLIDVKLFTEIKRELCSGVWQLGDEPTAESEKRKRVWNMSLNDFSRADTTLPPQVTIRLEEMIQLAREPAEANQLTATNQSYYWSPVHIAALREHKEMLDLLVSYGADLDAPSCGACDCRGDPVSAVHCKTCIEDDGARKHQDQMIQRLSGYGLPDIPIGTKSQIDDATDARAWDLQRAVYAAASACDAKEITAIMTRLDLDYLPTSIVDDSLWATFKNTDGAAGVETVRVLLAAIAPSSHFSLCLPCVFDTNHALQLTVPGALASRMKIFALIVDYIQVRGRTSGVDLPEASEEADGGQNSLDLTAVLLSACKPGGLMACIMLAGMGALEDLLQEYLPGMLAKAIPTPKLRQSMEDHHDDPALTRWILEIAQKLGYTKWLIPFLDLETVVDLGLFKIAKAYVDFGARPRIRGFTSWKPKTGLPVTLFAAQTGEQVFVYGEATIIHKVCAAPERPGAVELLNALLTLSVATTKLLVNSVADCGQATTLVTPACYLARYHDATANSQACEMMDILLQHGAECHGLIMSSHHAFPEADDAEATDLFTRSKAGDLTPADMDKDDFRAAHWQVVPWHASPMELAIRNNKPDMVESMLKAQALTKPGSILAKTYLKLACGMEDTTYWVPRVDVLDKVIAHANATADDLSYALSLPSLVPLAAPDLGMVTHKCWCEPELKEGSSDLKDCIFRLLDAGAQWSSPHSVTNPIASLRQLAEMDLKELEVPNGGTFHNLEVLREALTKNWDEDVVNGPGFSPWIKDEE
ncbi:hypothetical protein OQA88_3057 [Cercophora sp. LCS_1]